MCTPKPRQIPFGSRFQTTIIECHGALEPPSCPSFSGPRPNKCSTWLWSDSMSATERWSSEILSLGKRSLPRLCQCPFFWCKISIFPLDFGDLHRFYLGGSWRINISVSMYVIHHTNWPLKAEIQQLRLSERSDSSSFRSLHQESTVGSSTRYH